MLTSVERVVICCTYIRNINTFTCYCV